MIHIYELILMLNGNNNNSIKLIRTTNNVLILTIYDGNANISECK